MEQWTIDKMNIEQKLQLLSGALSGAIDVVDFDGLDLNLNGYINSFNMPTINKLFLAVSNAVPLHGMVVLGDMSLKLNPFGEGLSEDAFLCGRYGSVMAAGLCEGGATAALGSLGFRGSDLDYIDLEPAHSLVSETVKPFKLAVTNSGALAMVNFEKLPNNYQKTSVEVLKQLNLTNFCAVGGGANAIKAGALFVYEGYNALYQAYQAYLKLKQEFDSGTISLNDYQTQLSEGDCLSLEMIDNAVLRALDFAKSLDRPANTQPLDLQRICRDLSQASVVLLKNSQALPLFAGARVGVIGQYDQSFCELLAKNSRVRLSGRELGYELDGQRNDELHSKAIRLAQNSDVILLFLQRAPNQNTLRLSPNRLKLIDDLNQLGKKVVAVISEPLDMGFDVDCNSVVLLPKSQLNYTAFLDILTGEVNPSGKLPFTLYEHTDTVFSEIKRLKDARNLKIGRFLGYKYYDTAEVSPKYEFGFGLSYSDFSYSRLSIDGNTVSFDVKNNSALGGAEVAQLYIGKKNSALPVPKKQLVGFSRVFLPAHSTQRVSIKFNLDDLKVQYGDQLTLEDGAYTVFVGGSVSDIRLKKNINLGGQRLVGQAGLEDYIQTKSNILSSGYLFGGGTKTMLSTTKPFEQLFIEEFEQNLPKKAELIEDFDKSLTAKGLAAMLSENLTNCGFNLSTVSVNALVASMLCNRLILVQNSGFLSELLGCVGDCFGKASIIESLDYFSPPTPSTNIETIVIQNSDPETLDALSVYSNKPDIGAVAYKQNLLKIPPNMWFFVAVQPHDFKKYAPNNAVMIDLKLNKVPKKAHNLQYDIHYLSFLQAAQNSLDSHLLEEAYFKRVDSLIGYTQAFMGKKGLGFDLSNRDWHTLEKLSAVYFELSNNAALSLEFAVAALLILTLNQVYLGANGELCTNLERALGDSASQCVLNARRIC